MNFNNGFYTRSNDVTLLKIRLTTSSETPSVRFVITFSSVHNHIRMFYVSKSTYVHTDMYYTCTTPKYYLHSDNLTAMNSAHCRKTENQYNFNCQRIMLFAAHSKGVGIIPISILCTGVYIYRYGEVSKRTWLSIPAVCVRSQPVPSRWNYKIFCEVRKKSNTVRHLYAEWKDGGVSAYILF